MKISQAMAFQQSSCLFRNFFSIANSWLWLENLFCLLLKDTYPFLTDKKRNNHVRFLVTFPFPNSGRINR